MDWIDIDNESPEYTDKKYGAPYLVRLKPKIDNPRKNGDTVIAVYYKGCFHWEFWKGKKMEVTHWMPLPKPPKD